MLHLAARAAAHLNWRCPTSHSGADGAMKSATFGYNSAQLYKVNPRAELPSVETEFASARDVAARSDLQQRRIFRSVCLL